MKAYAKSLGGAVTRGLLILTLVMAPVMSGCNPTSAVNAIGEVANNFLSNCAVFTSNAADQTACTAINGVVQSAVTEFDSAYNAYTTAKGGTATNLQALEAAISAALKNLPAALSQFRIVDANSQSKIIGEIELIVSAFEIIAGFFGVATPAMASHLQRVTSGSVTMVKKGDWRGADKQVKLLKVQWNTSVCGGLTGTALAHCTVK